jgi:REP element-mobilizing transposase RayT
MSGGYRKEAIFVNDENRRRFLRTLGDVCKCAGWGRHAYCLMSNHFHVVVETPKPTLVIEMKWFLGT